MTVFRIALTIARKHYKPLLSNISLQHRTNILIATMTMRNLSSMEVTKNIELISVDKKDVKLDNLRLQPPQEKPLVVMLSWLLSKKKHVDKYAQFYVHHGYDVLNISVTPWQLLWPSQGSQLVARDVLKFLDSNFTHSPLFLHGFSIGAYVWGEVLVKVAAELPKYQPIVDRVVGQVWDSAADITEIPVGFPMAVFPTNAVMQSTLRQYIRYHMKTFDKVATCHYVRSSQMFHTNLIHAPALFFLSKTDPVGAERSNQRVRESWESMGMDVTWKCWDKSPHVGHFTKHPQEYKGMLTSFMEKVNVDAKQVHKMQAKL